MALLAGLLPMTPHFPQPMVRAGKHYCPTHRTEEGRVVHLTLCADDYAIPTEWFECPVQREKYSCDHLRDGYDHD